MASYCLCLLNSPCFLDTNIPLISCLTVPLHGLGKVLRHIKALHIHETKIGLRDGRPNSSFWRSALRGYPLWVTGELGTAGSTAAPTVFWWRYFAIFSHSALAAAVDVSTM